MGLGLFLRNSFILEPLPPANITRSISLLNIYFLQYLINNFSKYPFRRIYLLTGYRNEIIFKNFHKKIFNFTEVICLKEKNLDELIKRVHDQVEKLRDYKYELIFVNDDSNDNSEKILRNLQKKFPITLINMSRTFGVGPCVLAGFKQTKGDCIIYMDSDLQDPPELISELIAKYEKGADVVHTIRTKRLGEPFLKLFITKSAYKIINFCRI